MIRAASGTVRRRDVTPDEQNCSCVPPLLPRLYPGEDLLYSNDTPGPGLVWVTRGSYSGGILVAVESHRHRVGAPAEPWEEDTAK